MFVGDLFIFLFLDLIKIVFGLFLLDFLILSFIEFCDVLGGCSKEIVFFLFFFRGLLDKEFERGSLGGLFIFILVILELYELFLFCWELLFWIIGWTDVVGFFDFIFILDFLDFVEDIWICFWVKCFVILVCKEIIVDNYCKVRKIFVVISNLNRLDFIIICF